MRRLKQYLFAKLLDQASKIHEPLVARRKQRLLAGVQGKVLEIGPGSGPNFRYLGEAAHLEKLLWTGYEPNPFLAKQIPIPQGGRLFEKPFTGEEQDTFDYAICTLVLCSVSSPRQSLADLYRALRPGGKLLYLEHVAAAPGSALRSAQERWLPLWRCAADGCHPNRPTSQWIREAGFFIEEEEQFSLPLWLAGPHIAGVARKP